MVRRGVAVYQPKRQRSLWQEAWKHRWCYVFMLPSLILTGMFTFYPIVASWYFAFLDWSGFAAARTFVGLANFREVMTDDLFWGAFRRSMIFMVTSVPLQMGLSLIVAIVLNDRALKLAPVFRTMFFIPVVTTTAIVGIVMSFVFSPFNGPVNDILRNLGVISRPIDFLGGADTALWTVIGVFVWKWFGITMIYWLASLQTIPQDLYEAARLDGATRPQLLRYIILPLLTPFAIVILLITAVGSLNVFALVQTMTGGGPFFASEVMEVYIYRTAFGTGGGGSVPRLGYASAAGVFFGIAVMFITIVQGLAVRRIRTRPIS
jgi:multiple sugar transport system permease protein